MIPTHNTDALLMAALQFVHVPYYSALLMRRTYADLAKPDSLMPRSFAWLGGKASWKAQDHAWKFDSGATLSFGYLDSPTDKYQYQSATYQFIGFDELTQFREADYRYMFSRLRKPEGSKVPLRMRSASNPGGAGHEWVKRRFIVEGKENGRWFIPARLADNPYLNQESYTRSLAQLDPVTRRQLLEGDWTARQPGSMFKREWFEIVSGAPVSSRRVRFWDMAATMPKKGKDPDWTAGALVSRKGGVWFIEDVQHFRKLPKANEEIVRQTAVRDGLNTITRMEQEGGSSGPSLIDHYARNVLVGFNFLGMKPAQDKITRAGPFSSAAESGNVKLVNGPWVGDFLDEVEAFPDGEHDDQVDAVSGAMLALGTEFGTNLSGAHLQRKPDPDRQPVADRLGRDDF